MFLIILNLLVELLGFIVYYPFKIDNSCLRMDSYIMFGIIGTFLFFDQMLDLGPLIDYRNTLET